MRASALPIPSRRRRRWTRLRALLVLGLLCGGGSTASLASWADQEQAAATFTAAVVPAAELTRDCSFVYGLLGLTVTHVEVHWRLPEGAAFEDVVVSRSTDGLGSLLAPITGFSLAGSTSQNADGSYRTRIPVSLLGGLVGLNAGLRVGITVVPPEGDDAWRSETAMVEANLGVLAGIGAYCTRVS